jgi:hypothetical protein
VIFVEVKLGFIGTNRNNFPSLSSSNNLNLTPFNTQFAPPARKFSPIISNNVTEILTDFYSFNNLGRSSLQSSEKPLKLSLFLNKCNYNGGCSLTVEYEPVALGTGVRLPSSAFVSNSGELTW